MACNSITYQSVPDQSVPDQSVPHKGSRKKGSRSNFGTFLVCPEQFSKRPEGDALNVHKSRMYTNQDIHMRVWDHMKCIPTGLPNLKECPPGHIIHPGCLVGVSTVRWPSAGCLKGDLRMILQDIFVIVRGLTFAYDICYICNFSEC